MSDNVLISPSSSAAGSPAAGMSNYLNQKRFARESLNGQRSISDWDDSADGSYKQMFQLVANSSSATPTMKPAGDGEINIVDDFKWTYSNFREEVPRVRLIERQIEYNQQLSYYKRTLGVIESAATGAGRDPYADLYKDAKPTEFYYTFPYYSNTTYSVNQAWSGSINSGANIYGSLVNKVGDIPIPGTGVTVAKASETIQDLYAMNSETPMFGYEQPQYYNGPQIQAYTIKFPLFNTDTVADIRRNFDFIKIFGYQNLFERRTFGTSWPPVIYECDFSDGHIGTMAAKPAMYVSRFEAKNVGAIRSIDIGIGAKILVPEAYIIEIQLTELVANSRNIFASFIIGQSVVSVS